MLNTTIKSNSAVVECGARDCARLPNRTVEYEANQKLPSADTEHARYDINLTRLFPRSSGSLRLDQRYMSGEGGKLPELIKAPDLISIHAIVHPSAASKVDECCHLLRSSATQGDKRHYTKYTVAQPNMSTYDAREDGDGWRRNDKWDCKKTVVVWIG